MSRQTFIQRLEDYKYNAVNGNWTTALIIDNDVFGHYHHNSTIQSGILKVEHVFHITSRQKALRKAQQRSAVSAPRTHLVVRELRKLRQHRFPWVYIRHDHLAYPLVKNILWNALNQIETQIKRK